MNQYCDICLTMSLRKYVYLGRISRRFCSYEKTQSSQVEQQEKKIVPSRKVADFFRKDETLKPLLKIVAPKYLQMTKQKTPESLYMICPRTAKIIADKIVPLLDLNNDGIIAETCPGPALISQELLKRGAKKIRLYESGSEFFPHLQELVEANPKKLVLHQKNIFHLYRYEYIDKQDNGKRVESLVSDMPPHPWDGDPFMKIIGCLGGLTFFKYLLRSLALQTGFVTLGRLQIFALMYPRHYAVFSSTRENNLTAYQKWTVLFNLFFDHQILEKFSNQVVIPWCAKLKMKKRVYLRTIDPDKIYLVEIKFKKELPVPANQLLHLYYFVRNIYGLGNSRVIPTAERWVPDSGLNILLPSLQHEDYYPDFDIHTLFRDLTPQQVLAVYKEIVNSRGYAESPFFAMIENELLRSETIEPSMVDPNLGKRIEADIEEKLKTE